PAATNWPLKASAKVCIVKGAHIRTLATKVNFPQCQSRATSLPISRKPHERSEQEFRHRPGFIFANDTSLRPLGFFWKPGSAEQNVPNRREGPEVFSQVFRLNRMMNTVILVAGDDVPNRAKPKANARMFVEWLHCNDGADDQGNRTGIAGNQ